MLSSLVAISQENKRTLKPRIVAAIGIMGGESEARPVYQLSAGLAFGRYFIGGGFGQDRYKFNSLPIFGDFRVDIGSQRKLFSYLNVGHNFFQKLKKDELSNEITSKLHGGFYFDGGMGLRIKLANNHKVLLSGGFSWKNLTQIRTFPIFCIGGDCPDQIVKDRYGLGRFTTKLSWELW